MVPLGVASAGAVRVGQAVGRRDPRGAARAGWTAMLFGVGVHGERGRRVPRHAPPADSLRSRTTRACSRSASSLLFVAAVFQLFDGLQGVATGVLRGLGDTRTAMFWNLAGHWFVGLPLGYCSVFVWGWASSACGGDCRLG